MPRQTQGETRRDFLKASTAAVSAATLVTLPAGGVFAAGTDAIRIGLIGCGGRGTGAAVNAVTADSNAKITAMGDAFADRLASSHENLAKTISDKVDCPPERRYVGIDAYRKVIESGVDVVLLASPPHFRPAHLAAAIKAGKHVFCEKPVAVDVPGVHSVEQSCKLAREKKLSIVSGLCFRYDEPKVETIRRIHDGAIGKPLVVYTRYLTGLLWNHPRKPEWSDMEWQLRNWLYFNWLSGDHIVEQHSHSLDKAVWVMGDEPPMAAVGVGGREVRTDAAFGNIYDHFSIVYTYADGRRIHSSCRQMGNCFTDVEDTVIGTEGSCDLMKHAIEGARPWKFQGHGKNMYQSEHDALFAAIRSGTPIDNGSYMCRSTLVAIMGRMVAYTGERITWDQLNASTEDLTPPSYEMGPLPMAPVAKPGVKLIG